MLYCDINIYYPCASGLLHWHWGNHMIAPVPVKWPWRICLNKLHKSPIADNQNKTKHNKTMSIYYGTWCIFMGWIQWNVAQFHIHCSKVFYRWINSFSIFNPVSDLCQVSAYKILRWLYSQSSLELAWNNKPVTMTVFYYTPSVGLMHTTKLDIFLLAINDLDNTFQA